MEIWLGAALVALLLLVVAGNVSTTTVFEHERALRYDRGRLTGVVGPGRYRYWRPRITLRAMDMRPHLVPVAGQEILSADGVTLRITIVASYEVVDAERAVAAAEDYEAALYTELQLALRSIVGTAPVDDVLAKRGELGARLRERAESAIAALGLRLLNVDVRDIMFPGELKRVFAQVVAAQKEGQAALERARGETAALRNLANAAQAVSDNPALLQLRLLQQLGNTTGNTIVLGLGATPTVVPPPPPAEP